jgi:hypothetical protein
MQWDYLTYCYRQHNNIFSTKPRQRAISTVTSPYTYVSSLQWSLVKCVTEVSPDYYKTLLGPPSIYHTSSNCKPNSPYGGTSYYLYNECIASNHQRASCYNFNLLSLLTLKAFGLLL